MPRLFTAYHALFKASRDFDFYIAARKGHLNVDRETNYATIATLHNYLHTVRCLHIALPLYYTVYKCLVRDTDIDPCTSIASYKKALSLYIYETLNNTLLRVIQEGLKVKFTAIKN